ncbi:MAG: hypothetical protein ACOX6T_19450 [Myxococcales bacterium]
MARQNVSAKKVLERLRSNEPVSSLAADLGVREAEVALAREVVRRIGEHQAEAAGRLSDALARAVVEAAVQIEHAGFLKAVAESGNKSASGAARRGLAILKSRGIEVSVEPTGQPVYRPESLRPEELRCLVSTHDTLGDRLLWIPRPQRGGGLQLLTVLISDDHGITRVELDEVNRRSFRRLRDDMLASGTPHGIALLEIPLSRAKGLIAAARQKMTRGLDIEEEAVLANLSGDPREAEPLAKRDPPLPEPLESQRVSESALLHDEPEVTTWYADEAAAHELGLKLDEVMTSSLYVDEPQRIEQAEREIDRAVERYFDQDRLQTYANRLFELVEAFRQNGRAEAAERAGAAARALARGADPATVPFCRRLFEKLLRRPLAGSQERPAEPQPEPEALIVPGR